MRREDFQRPRPPAIDRPADRWICGHADSGAPCVHGPDAAGGCQAMGPCQPVAEGESWRCARPICLGGKCEEGPAVDGQCGLTPRPCTPRPSWRHQRRRWFVTTLAASLAVVFLLAGGGWRIHTLRPGKLTQPHAQILASRFASDRCAACHPAAQQSLLHWFSSAGEHHRDVSQSQLCIDCHHSQLDRDRSLLAHNLTADELHVVAAGRSRWHSSWRDQLPAAAVDNANVHCAACHREHHGADADLTTMRNDQCQTCHQDRFHRFATDHPDWQDWPYQREEAVSFDHATHFGKHFLRASDSQAEPFRESCQSCHPRDGDGEVARLATFTSSCAVCHDESLRVNTSEGVTLLAIPALVEAPPSSVEPWPPAASGFYDGRVGPLTRLLIEDQGSVSDALRQLPPESDFARIDTTKPVQVAAAERVAVAIRELLDDLSVRGDAAIVDRLGRQGVAEATARQIARGLSPQMLYDARQRWFGQPPPRDPIDTSPLGEVPALPEQASSDEQADAPALNAVVGLPRGNAERESGSSLGRTTLSLFRLAGNDLAAAGTANSKTGHSKNPLRMLAPLRTEHGDRPRFAQRPEPPRLKPSEDPLLMNLKQDLNAEAQRRRNQPPPTPPSSTGARPEREPREANDPEPSTDVVSPAVKDEDDPVAPDKPAEEETPVPVAGSTSTEKADPTAVTAERTSDALSPEPTETFPAPTETEQPTSIERQRREDFDAAAALSSGGWFQDERQLAIRYRGGDHADPVIRAVIELAVELPPDDERRKELLALPAAASCLACHPAPGDAHSLRWGHGGEIDSPRRFTKFSHQPHLNLARLQSCTQCHQIRELREGDEEVPLVASAVQMVARGVASPSREFLPLTRQSCAACHTKQAAGDRCTQCHRYHVDPVSLRMAPLEWTLGRPAAATRAQKPPDASPMVTPSHRR